jgi:drug/metabolite transporter (DMT)-like permease
MIAVLGGLGAAVCWTVTGVFAQRASRRIGELSTFAWASMIGFGIAVIPGVIAIHSSTSTARTFVVLALSGVFNVVGLVAQFSALRRGPVSVVVPISSTEGAIAAVLAATTGSHLPPAGWVAIAILIAGVAITAGSQWSGEDPHTRLKPVGLAGVAAVCFGTGLFLQGQGGQHAPVALAVVPPSLMGTLLVALPMVSRRRLAPPRGSRGWLIGVAVAELLGFVSYILGARQSVPIGITALRERMVPAQVIGLILTIGGVTIISLLG